MSIQTPNAGSRERHECKSPYGCGNAVAAGAVVCEACALRLNSERDKEVTAR